MSSTLDSSLASNIQKLFSEKVDYFAPVEQSKVDTICNNFERLHIFCQQYIYGISTKVSVLTAIIKLGLKTLLECVRLQTFGRYGLQQMQVQRANVVLIQPLSMSWFTQVDCHYLQLYLWRFVTDEAVVQQLLEEVSDLTLSCSLLMTIFYSEGAWLCSSPQPWACFDGVERGGGDLRQGRLDFAHLHVGHRVHLRVGHLVHLVEVICNKGG